ncbi:hypothetical protein ABZ391_21225, partial [Kitasatospora cineracea]
MTTLDVDDLVAIDMHTHAQVSLEGRNSLPDEIEEASAAYFKVERKRYPNAADMAGYYRERKMACVIFPVDAEAATGAPAVPKEEVADCDQRAAAVGGRPLPLPGSCLGRLRVRCWRGGGLRRR